MTTTSGIRVRLYTSSTSKSVDGGYGHGKRTFKGMVKKRKVNLNGDINDSLSVLTKHTHLLNNIHVCGPSKVVHITNLYVKALRR